MPEDKTTTQNTLFDGVRSYLRTFPNKLESFLKSCQEIIDNNGSCKDVSFDCANCPANSMYNNKETCKASEWHMENEYLFKENIENFVKEFAPDTSISNNNLSIEKDVADVLNASDTKSEEVIKTDGTESTTETKNVPEEIAYDNNKPTIEDSDTVVKQTSKHEDVNTKEKLLFKAIITKDTDIDSIYFAPLCVAKEVIEKDIMLIQDGVHILDEVNIGCCTTLSLKDDTDWKKCDTYDGLLNRILIKLDKAFIMHPSIGADIQGYSSFETDVLSCTRTLLAVLPPNIECRYIASTDNFNELSVLCHLKGIPYIKHEVNDSVHKWSYVPEKAIS